MSNPVYRRCGCRDKDGMQLGAACPLLKTESRHGLWGYYLSYSTEADPSKPGKRRRRQFRKSGYRTKGEAQKALTKLRASLDVGTYTEPSKITLAEDARQWLARRQVTGSGLKATTLAGYTTVTSRPTSFRLRWARCS